MTDSGNEIFYLLILIIFWIIVPAIINTGFFVFFCRLSRTDMYHKKIIEDTKWQVKWGHRWDGTPYKIDEGWGTGYSKLSELDYFTKLNKEREMRNGKSKQIFKD